MLRIKWRSEIALEVLRPIQRARRAKTWFAQGVCQRNGSRCEYNAKTIQTDRAVEPQAKGAIDHLCAIEGLVVPFVVRGVRVLQGYRQKLLRKHREEKRLAI
jgi:hypothetical protein